MSEAKTLRGVDCGELIDVLRSMSRSIRGVDPREISFTLKECDAYGIYGHVDGYCFKVENDHVVYRSRRRKLKEDPGGAEDPVEDETEKVRSVCAKAEDPVGPVEVPGRFLADGDLFATEDDRLRSVEVCRGSFGTDEQIAEKFDNEVGIHEALDRAHLVHENWAAWVVEHPVVCRVPAR